MKAQLESSPLHSNVLGIRSTDKIHKSKHKEEENEEIKAYLTKLQEIVPFMPKHKKLSKLEVITYVIDYIRDLRQTLGLPLSSARVPMIPSMDMDLDVTSGDPTDPSPSSSSVNNNNVSSVNLHHLSMRTPLSQISTPNNISSCGSQEIPQLTDKSPTGDVDTRPVSC